ncbi:hypothetical protein SL057_001375 [Flavobacterium psychrophilum]|nr:hypothetical protein [Flavobacterium psychrophilum]
MINEDYNHQETAYNNYLRAFYPSILFKETIYKDLYSTLIDENLTRASMGDYFYEKYLNKINENIKKIEIEITNYIEINSLKDDAKEYLLYFKPILENKVLELLNYNKQITYTSTIEHPKQDPNLWNEKCFELFKYIFDNYYKGSKRQLTNIWYYLKEYKPTQYTLKATKEQYIEFISSNYNIKITNTDKAQNKYVDKEFPTMNEHRQNFEDSFK